MAHTPDNSASIYQILRSITESGHQSHALVDYLRGHDGDGTPKPGVEILPLLIPKKNTLCHPCHTFLSTFLRRDFSNSEIWSPLAPNTFCYEAMSVNHDALERSVRLLNCTICRFFSRASAEKLDKTFTPGQPVVWGTWTLQPSMLGHWTAEPFVFYFGSTAYRNLGLACGPPNFAAYLAPSPRHLDREDGLSKLPGLQFRRSGPAGMEYITGLREAPPLTVHSSEVAPMIKRWQEQCLSSHKNCQRLVLSAQQRPKRLVRVSRGEWGVHSVRLVESAVNEPYLALSYAWGNALPLKTTKESVGEFLIDIPFDSLPRTLREAVALTVDLGYEHIWIDALCIIQNDPDDWAIEGSKMHWIYQGAALTISAAASKDCAAGLFPDRTSILRSEPVELEIVSRSTDAAEAETNKIEVHPPHHANPSHKKAIVLQYDMHERLPPHIRARDYLSKRGWVLQERVLSPALVHFATTDTIWECREHCVSETGDRSSVVDKYFKGVRTINDVKDGGSGGRLNLAEDSERNWHRRWLNVVVNYTERELTYPEDKLAAVAGLARYVRDNGLESRYLAGHWVDKWFVESLTWYRANRDVVVVAPGPEGPEGLEGKKPSYIAPSWSWASIIGRVKFTYTLTDMNSSEKSVLNPGFTFQSWGVLADQRHKWPPGDESVYGRLPSPVNIVVSGMLFPQLPSSHVDMAAAEAFATLVNPKMPNSFEWKTGDEEKHGNPMWRVSWDRAEAIPSEWCLLYTALEARRPGGSPPLGQTDIAQVDVTWHLLILKQITSTELGNSGGIHGTTSDGIPDYERIGKAVCTVNKVNMRDLAGSIPSIMKGNTVEELVRIW